MKKSRQIIRISCMAVLCALLLSVVCMLPTVSPCPPAATDPPTEDVPPSPPEYVTVDGDALGIVDESTIKYSYSDMVSDLFELEKKHGDKMSYSVIGSSLDGRNIYAVVLGNQKAEKQILISAGIHAREYLTPLLVMKQLEFYLYNYDTAEYGGVPLSEIFEEYSFCILPMCNPDGITLAQFGIGSIRDEDLRDSIRAIYESDKELKYTTDPIEKYLTYWKANARGVDLNRNFGTRDWEDLTQVKKPSYINYRGSTPLSEPESKAMADFVGSLSNPILSLAIHSQGEIIYFDCGQDNIHPALDLAKTAKESCGYKIMYQTKRDAAFEDWCVINNDIPSITVETGNYSVKEPIPEGEFARIWKACRDLWAHVAVSYMNQD